MKRLAVLPILLALLACGQAPEPPAGESSPATASVPARAAAEPQGSTGPMAGSSGNAVEPASPKASVPRVRSAPPIEQAAGDVNPLDQARRMTPTELKALVDAGEVVIVDVRNATQWEAGRIEGAVHIPSGEVFERAGELPREKWIAFYCT